VDGHLHRYLGVLRHDVGPRLVVYAGDRRLLRDGVVALDEVFLADRGARLGGDEVVHVAVLLLLPEVEEALRGLQGRLGGIRLLTAGGVFAGGAGEDDEERYGEERRGEARHEPAHDGQILILTVERCRGSPGAGGLPPSEREG